MKRFNTITKNVDTSSILRLAFASGVDLPVGILLSGTSLRFSLPTAITQKSFKIFTLKPPKHVAIKLLAQSKFDSTADIISQTMRDRNISLNLIKYYKR